MDGNSYIYTDLSALPADEHEAYLAEGFGGVCTGGTAVIEVFSTSCRISKKRPGDSFAATVSVNP